MKYVVWILIVSLIILHQDYWQWDNATLVFGILPYSLLYHAAISVGAAIVWLLVVQFYWPDGMDEFNVDEADGDVRT